MYRFSNGTTDGERRRQYERIRDVLAGEDRIKARGAAYLPRHDGETINSFRARLARSSFPNYALPTLNAMTGKAFRVGPLVQWPDERLPFLYRGDECSWAWGAEFAFREVATTGRLLAVLHVLDGADTSRFAATRIGLYRAEAIKEVVCRKGVVTSITVEDGACEADELMQFRLDEEGFFEVAIVTLEGVDKRIAFPSMLGRRLPYVPAVFIGPMDLSHEADRPPLLDIVDANLAHYVLQSEYRSALYWTASPQPVATGFAAEEMPRALGPNTIIRSSNADAKFEFVTFSGDGLAEQRLALAASRADMAALGAGLLLPKGGSNIAARTVELRQAEDNSVCVSIINSVEAGLRRLQAMIVEWERRSDEVSITLNRDLVEATIDAPLLKALHEAYLAGSISFQTWIENLQRGEVLPASRTADDEQDLIELGVPGDRTNVDAAVE